MYPACRSESHDLKSDEQKAPNSNARPPAQAT
jgi:hypothetical protein